jgi:hypothetical protein
MSRWCLAGLLSVLAGCSLPEIRPAIRLGRLAIEGDVSASAQGLVNASSSASELGLDSDDADPVLMGRLDFDFDPLHVVLDGFDVDYRGTGVARGDLNLNGITIPAQSNVESSLDLGMYTGTAIIDLIPLDVVEAGIGLGVGLFRYDLEFNSLDAPLRVLAEDEQPFGFVAARAAIDFFDFELIGLGRGIGFELDDEDFLFYDIDVSLSYDLIDVAYLHLHLLGGYRYIYLSYDFEDHNGRVDSHVEMHGPYVGAALGLEF